jgi:dimethylhistidine N-methyltransferase
MPHAEVATSRRIGAPGDALLAELAQARGRTDLLFARVPENLLYHRPIAQRHRVAFYLGHLEAFDANLLRCEDTATAQHDRRFGFGIDPVGGGLPADAPADWPTIAGIRSYVEQARRRVDRRLAECAGRPIGGVALATLLHTAIEHRLMHAETLAYMLNHLPIDKPLRALQRRAHILGDDDMVAVPAGAATLGTRVGAQPFAWDNEFVAHTVEVPAFTIDRHMVTNAQFLRFIEAGGYDDPRWWTTADRDWLGARGIAHPASWRRAPGKWQLLSWSDVVPFQGDWPVYVSHAEASAYARSACKVLPTEVQWHRAAFGEGGGAERLYPWGMEPPQAKHGNFDFPTWDPVPVDAHPAGASAFGVAGLLGNGWEWTATPFAPFTGFQGSAHYGLLRRFLRRSAFRSQGWIGAYGGAPAAPLLPQLVPAALPVSVRGLSLREAAMTRPLDVVRAAPAPPSFAADVRAGLTGAGGKSLPPKYFYDALGSALFEAITQLPEYGLWRAERLLLDEHAAEIAALTQATMVVELGSGSANKTVHLLRALLRQHPVSYCTVDLSAAALAMTRRELADLQGLSLRGLEHEYLHGLKLALATRSNRSNRTLVLFLGSSLGNFDPSASQRFLTDIRATLRTGDSLLLGADLDKSVDRLLAAYDDPLGVTAAFNLNLLARMNRELGADFDLPQFRHRARFNAVARDVEMHIESLCDQVVHFSAAGFAVPFRRGETIHSESSHKYSIEELGRLTTTAGFERAAQWVSAHWDFASSLLTVA